MKVCFIYNPESGKGKIRLYINWIFTEFIKKGHKIDLFETTKRFDAYNYAINAKGYDMLLVAGGDGTLNEAVNGIMQLEKRPLIGYIPTGTTNDVGHLLGIPRNIKRAVKLILNEAVIKPMDISRINNKYFVYAAAAGKFTSISYAVERKYKKRYGPLAYFFGSRKEMFKEYNMPIKATFENGTFEADCALVLIIKGRRIGGFKLFAVKSKIDDGKLSARFFKKESWMFLRVIAFFLTGGLYDTRKNTTFTSSYFKIQTDASTKWNTDGELAYQGSIEIEVVPKAVEFMLNPKKTKKLLINGKR